MDLALRLLCLLELQREERRRSRRMRRTLRLRSGCEVLADHRDFQKIYRLTPELFEELCREIAPLLPQPKRSDSITPAKKIMTTLAFLASGDKQRMVGSTRIAQQTVSQMMHQVTAALNDPHILMKFIRFPQNQSEREQIKEGFFKKFGMPGVLGCIDCTHVAMTRPRENEDRYFNRKYFHSRNVQLVCDANLRIINVDASFGGASYDSYVFQQSTVKRHLEQLEENTWLLGDTGYPLRKYLMIPINTAATDTPEGQYNAIHKMARKTIERTIQILKGRWRCLLVERELYYDPLTVGKIINACCVLHNFCNAQPTLTAPPLSPRDRRIEQYLQERPHEVVVLRQTAADELQAGQLVQANLVQELSRNRN